ncbi:MAG: bifunctional precorrin-2 dehydrogenase/sirohydrochlorin ferrochelatase [Rhodospirillales bacterium]
MLPIVLDAAKLRIALVGEGPRAERRLALLREGGADKVAVFATAPETYAGFDLVYFVEADRKAAAEARAQGALVNVEDVLEFCDFHTPAILRRADLTVTVSTAGRAAGLAAVLVEYLARIFEPAWALRLAILEAKRRTWRAEGLNHPQIRAKLKSTVDHAGWLPDLAPSADASARSQSQKDETLRKTSLAVGQTM